MTGSNVTDHTPARKCLDPRHLGRKESRLGVLGASQCCLVTCLDDVPQVKPKRVACPFEQLASQNQDLPLSRPFPRIAILARETETLS